MGMQAKFVLVVWSEKPHNEIQFTVVPGWKCSQSLGRNYCRSSLKEPIFNPGISEFSERKLQEKDAG